MARRRQPHGTRGRLVLDAVMARRLLAYGDAIDEGGKFRARLDAALEPLTDHERRFVEDVEGDRVPGRVCLQQLVESRFGPVVDDPDDETPLGVVRQQGATTW